MTSAVPSSSQRSHGRSQTLPSAGQRGDSPRGAKASNATAIAATAALQQLMDERQRRRVYGPAVKPRRTVVGGAADGIATIVTGSMARVGLPRWAIIPIVLLAACGAAGYAAAGARHAAAPGSAIAGKVVLDGKPLAQASLEFHATARAENGIPVSLRIETDHEGAFRRAAAVGVPTGTYAVVVRSGCIMPHPSAEVGRPVRIPARYASVASTPLKVEVKGEASTFDLVLRH